MKQTLHASFFCAFFFLTTVQGISQTDTLAPTLLRPVEVTATRFTGSDLQTPYGLSTLDKTQLQAGQQQLSPAEFLATVPGVFFMNADNFAQDLRVSIRGVGARSAFGIRGVKIIVDELPETTPDGQGQIDNLDPGHLDRLEVIRGPASGLYGNASGGVLSFRTEEAPEQPFLQLGTPFRIVRLSAVSTQNRRTKRALAIPGQRHARTNGGVSPTKPHAQYAGKFENPAADQ